MSYSNETMPRPITTYKNPPQTGYFYGEGDSRRDSYRGRGQSNPGRGNYRGQGSRGRGGYYNFPQANSGFPRGGLFGQRRGPTNGSSPRQHLLAQQPQILREDESWRHWVELTVRARGVPHDAKPMDMYNLLKQYGNISRIKMLGDRQQGDKIEALVTFCPPPKKDIWTTFKPSFTAIDDNTGRTQHYLLHLDKLDKIRSFTVASPVNKSDLFPEVMSVHLQSLSFGIMFQKDEMMVKYSVAPRQQGDIKLMLNLLRREVVLFFPLDDSTNTAGEVLRYEYKMQVQLKDLGVIMEEHTENETNLIISVLTPPEVYAKTKSLESMFDSGENLWAEQRAWIRQTSISNDQSVEDKPLSLYQPDSIIDIGRWTTYRVTLKRQEQNSTYNQIKRALEDHNVDFRVNPNLKTIPNRPVQVWNLIDHARKEMKLSVLLSHEHFHLDFDVRYQLEACISQGWIEEHNIDQVFLRILGSWKPEEAVMLLEHVAENKQRFYEPTEIFKLRIPRKCLEKRKKKKHDLRWVYTRLVTITPTGVIIGSPTLEVTNTIVRQYWAYADYFLRVKFSDEIGTGRLHPREDKTWDPVFLRVSRCLMKGIKIGERHFHFIASGNSQFREHGAYFFAPAPRPPSGPMTAEHIRGFIGDLRDQLTVAKYASRLGQCFSTTRAINIKKIVLPEIDDVKTTDGSYNFTDGVGKLSPFLAESIATEFGLTQIPSLFQFRLGGCKGVTVVSPDAIGHEMHIRYSQYKFAASNEGLDIIRWSAPCEGTLNRQLIIILKCLGVTESVFMVKLGYDLRSLQLAMDDQELALELLQTRVDAQQSTLAMASMIKYGFMETKEPFVMALLQLWRCWRLKKLKEKAAISIDQGVVAFGCTDETRTLKGYFHPREDIQNLSKEERIKLLPEIFLQVTDTRNPDKTNVIQGLCFVARNPSLHPGDIRVVRAVDNKRLHHLKDVVVFPQQGERDIPSMCSGGDLDGDDFLVVWDQDLLPSSWFEMPMTFDSLQGKLKGYRDATKAELVENFINHMKYDKIGKIANAHLAQADYLDGKAGARSIQCLQLAALHSTAVDFPKTGVPAELDHRLMPSRYPHYMPRKSTDKNYHSKTTLGRIYDTVTLANFERDTSFRYDSRVLNRFALTPETLRRAADLKSEYDYAMRRIMNQHDIKTEFEVWTGFVIDHGGYSKDYKLNEEVGRLMEALRGRFLTLCQEYAGGKDFEILGPFVAAMYTVTAMEDTEALEETRKNQHPINDDSNIPLKMSAGAKTLISFPWLFTSELGKIATGDDSIILDEIRPVQAAAHRHKLRVHPGGQEGEHDIETAEGITHKGETLELFHDANEYNPEGRTNETRQIDTPQTKVGVFYGCFEVNDLPQEAFSAVTNHDNIYKILRSTEASLELRGEKYPKGSGPKEPNDSPKLYMHIEGHTEKVVRMTTVELRRLANEAMIKANTPGTRSNPLMVADESDNEDEGEVVEMEMDNEPSALERLEKLNHS